MQKKISHLFLKRKRLTCPLNLNDIRFSVQIYRNPFSFGSRTWNSYFFLMFLFVELTEKKNGSPFGQYLDIVSRKYFFLVLPYNNLLLRSNHPYLHLCFHPLLNKKFPFIFIPAIFSYSFSSTVFSFSLLLWIWRS